MKGICGPSLNLLKFFFNPQIYTFKLNYIYMQNHLCPSFGNNLEAILSLQYTSTTGSKTMLIPLCMTAIAGF